MLQPLKPLEAKTRELDIESHSNMQNPRSPLSTTNPKSPVSSADRRSSIGSPVSSPYCETSSHQRGLSSVTGDDSGPVSPSEAGSLVGNWELPQRAKPGRKPMTANPPTKRRAQNRDAQRAFRERRAQRVGELEEEIEALNVKHAAEQKHLQSCVHDSSVLINHWKAAYEAEKLLRLEREQTICQREDMIREQQKVMGRGEVEQSRMSLAIPRWSSGDSSASGSTRLNSNSSMSSISPTSYGKQQISSAIPLPAHNNHSVYLPLPQSVVTRQDSSSQAGPLNESSIQPCQKCGVDGSCRCIEVLLSRFAPINPGLKEEDPMEIDFTTGPAVRNTAANPIAIQEENMKCGFCTDEANCLCNPPIDNYPTTLLSSDSGQLDSSDINSANARHNQSSIFSNSGTNSQLANPHLRAVRNKPQPIEPSTTTKGPGSCQSCLEDPERRRFCQTLAMLRPPSKSRNISQKRIKFNGPSDSIDERMTCTETYDVLATKLPDFEEQRKNPKFIQQLETRAHNQHNSRQPSSYDVEAASVLQALSRNERHEIPR